MFRICPRLSQPQLVHNLLMRKIQDVVNQFVVESEAILEIGSFKYSIAKFLTNLCFYCSDCTVHHSSLDVITDDKQVYPTFWVLAEYPRSNDEFDISGA